jgi:hypothetical protein
MFDFANPSLLTLLVLRSAYFDVMYLIFVFALYFTIPLVSIYAPLRYCTYFPTYCKYQCLNGEHTFLIRFHLRIISYNHTSTYLE